MGGGEGTGPRWKIMRERGGVLANGGGDGSEHWMRGRAVETSGRNGTDQVTDSTDRTIGGVGGGNDSAGLAKDS